jgi:hypothetical protein
MTDVKQTAERISTERLAALIPQLQEQVRLLEHRLSRSAIPEDGWEHGGTLADAKLKLSMATELLFLRQSHSTGVVEPSDEFIDRLVVQLWRYREIDIDKGGLRMAVTDALRLAPEQEDGQTVRVTAAGLIAIRDALSAGDINEAWHQLYSIADPTFCEMEPWRNLEHKAALSPVQDGEPVDDADEAYEIGKRDGYEQAVQDIDVLTGGDGEYRYCTDHDPDRHTPDAEAMKQRIVDRFNSPKEAEVTVTEEMVADTRIDIVSLSRGLWHPSNDQVREILVAALSRKG